MDKASMSEVEIKEKAEKLKQLLAEADTLRKELEENNVQIKVNGFKITHFSWNIDLL